MLLLDDLSGTGVFLYIVVVVVYDSCVTCVVFMCGLENMDRMFMVCVRF